MGFLMKRQMPELLPLIEAPKGGEPIVFDEEEQQAIDENVQRQLDYLKHDSGGRIFPREVTETLSIGFAVDALRNVVQRRTYHSDLKGAASTCMKLLGISVERSGDWLLLAKILALYGDAVRSRHFLNVAKKERRKYGETKDTKAYWQSKLRDVEDIIKSKGSEHK
jgi:hypothetical protein